MRVRAVGPVTHSSPFSFCLFSAKIATTLALCVKIARSAGDDMRRFLKRALTRGARLQPPGGPGCRHCNDPGGPGCRHQTSKSTAPGKGGDARRNRPSNMNGRKHDAADREGGCRARAQWEVRGELIKNGSGLGAHMELARAEMRFWESLGVRCSRRRRCGSRVI